MPRHRSPEAMGSNYLPRVAPRQRHGGTCPSRRLKPLQEAEVWSQAGITYVAAAARVADALTHDVLLAPIEASVIPWKDWWGRI